MVVTYCTAAQIVSFLKLTDTQGNSIVPDSTTDPTLAELEDLINEGEQEIETRTQHSWREARITNEPHDIINVYEWGRGIPVHLFHRNVRALNTGSGDKLEIWTGDNYDDITPDGSDRFNLHEEMGILYLRGFVFSIFRDNRIRITYRYGGEQGDKSATPVVPTDIRDCCRKLVSIKLLESSFAMNNIQFGSDRGLRTSEVVDRWRTDCDKIIERRSEWIHVEF